MRRRAAILAVLAIAGSAAAAAGADGPAKPPPPGAIMCVDDVCRPSTPDPRIDPIPPDLPPVVKLRRQLAKERRAHALETGRLRAALRACRAR